MNLKKRVGAVVAAALSASLVLAGGNSAVAANKTDLVIAVGGDIVTWDPIGANISYFPQFYQAAYDNLILRAPDGSYKPNLATKWTWAKDNMSLSLDLRKGVTFTDGAKFDAAAAKKSLDAYIAGVGPYTAKLKGATVNVVDSDTVNIKLATPNPALLYWLSTTSSYVASPNAIGTPGLKTKPVGSGPYILKTAQVGSQYVFEANPKYWDKAKQKFKKVTFKIIADQNAALNALLSGQVDAANLTSKTAPTAKAKGMSLISQFVDWKGLMLFDRDGKKNPALGNINVRKAIAYAVDRKAMLKAVEFDGQVTNQVFGAKTGAYEKEYDSFYQYNPATAKKFLEKGGYPNGFTLTLNTWIEPNFNALLEGYLKAVGITVKWDPNPNWYADSRAGKMEAIIMQIFQPGDFVTVETLAAKDGVWNPLKSTHPTINAAFAAIDANPSEKNVIAQSAKINQVLVEEAWLVPFYRFPTVTATSKRVKVVAQLQNVTPYLYNYSPTGK
jgi:peptide/nickel transport system substrate-binding protein